MLYFTSSDTESYIWYRFLLLAFHRSKQWILEALTCHGQLKCAEVAAKLVAGGDHQLPEVRASDALEPQGVLIVIWHAHFVHSWFIDQRRPPPGKHRGWI